MFQFSNTTLSLVGVGFKNWSLKIVMVGHCVGTRFSYNLSPGWVRGGAVKVIFCKKSYGNEVVYG